MTMYQIKLPRENLAALQRAIIKGAFAQPINLMRTQIEANRGSDRLVGDLMEEIGELQQAAQAVMDAAPVNESPTDFVRMVKEMRPGGVLDKARHFPDSAAKLAYILEQAELVKLS
jgi:23S rRNA A2030 N6-methylase RlmJ